MTRPAIFAALLLAAPATAETDACAHYAANFPPEVVAEWASDLVCGDTDWKAKGRALVADDPNPRLSELVARYGSGKAVRDMVEAQPPVIPLPASVWMPLSALAGLLTLKRCRT